MFHSKWKDCVITRLDKNYRQIQGWNQTKTNQTKHPFLRGTKYCEIIKKGTNWKFIFPWKVINWHGLEIGKAHFRYTTWFMISKKSGITRCMFLGNACVAPKSQQGTTSSNFFSPKTNFMWTSRFCRYERLYTYRSEKFQSNLERNSCNCFGQLLHVY